MDDKNLSTYAHNVKVIAQDGQVTLKGPVRTEEEKQTVEVRAPEVAARRAPVSRRGWSRRAPPHDDRRGRRSVAAQEPGNRIVRVEPEKRELQRQASVEARLCHQLRLRAIRFAIADVGIEGEALRCFSAAKARPAATAEMITTTNGRVWSRMRFSVARARHRRCAKTAAARFRIRIAVRAVAV